MQSKVTTEQRVSVRWSGERQTALERAPDAVWEGYLIDNITPLFPVSLPLTHTCSYKSAHTHTHAIFALSLPYPCMTPPLLCPAPSLPPWTPLRFEVLASGSAACVNAEKYKNRIIWCTFCTLCIWNKALQCASIWLQKHCHTPQTLRATVSRPLFTYPHVSRNCSTCFLPT